MEQIRAWAINNVRGLLLISALGSVAYVAAQAATAREALAGESRLREKALAGETRLREKALAGETRLRKAEVMRLEELWKADVELRESEVKRIEEHSRRLNAETRATAAERLLMIGYAEEYQTLQRKLGLNDRATDEAEAPPSK